jgi:hypothetical protein
MRMIEFDCIGSFSITRRGYQQGFNNGQALLRYQLLCIVGVGELKSVI